MKEWKCIKTGYYNELRVSEVLNECEREGWTIHPESFCETEVPTHQFVFLVSRTMK